MKKSEIRALADEAYTILDDFECEAAVERALSVLVNAPDDPESYLLMAEVAEENDRFDQALTWIDRGLTNFDGHEGLLLKKASLLLDGFEEIDDAFAILSQLRARFDGKSLDDLKREIGAPILLEVYLLLVDCFRLKAEFHEARVCAQSAYDIAPHDESAILGLATTNFELGDYEKALTLLEPIEERHNASDFWWQKAQILCAQGKFDDADLAFRAAHKADKARYHRPIRLDTHEFATIFGQALLVLPREIRNFVQTTTVTIMDVVPIDIVLQKHGTLSPSSCVSVDQKNMTPFIVLYQKNIENLTMKKTEIKDLIASALLHDLGKLVASH